jgi:anti-sigma-K factor RskA
MNITCNDRERIFLDGSPEEWTALEQHAATCAECAEELRAWKSLSVVAEELRDYQESPALWSKIGTALREEEQRRAARHSFWEKFAFWKGISLGWQTALAGAFVVVLAVSGVYVLTHRNGPVPSDSKLLRNSALAEVERTERDYMKAIDHLSAEAKPQLDSPATPLMASYKEKLMVLDSAIEELRIQTGRNPSNAHLRYQLLAMYQEKQETLQEVLETKP